MISGVVVIGFDVTFLRSLSCHVDVSKRIGKYNKARFRAGDRPLIPGIVSDLSDYVNFQLSDKVQSAKIIKKSRLVLI